ncbi:unnamed protein product [Owenia fusiformis]|uniref:Uncharacterized protein n=1 Tax=Owenia fusiformis TaxID=6347 RepID=A0A8J1TXP7_OWEFU|nr:unnamed protein product [Owenia fusiformis]
MCKSVIQQEVNKEEDDEDIGTLSRIHHSSELLCIMRSRILNPKVYQSTFILSCILSISKAEERPHALNTLYQSLKIKQDRTDTCPRERLVPKMSGITNGSYRKLYGTDSTVMRTSQNISVFMVGDVMLGRGIDNILSMSCDPKLYESYVKDANVYVTLAIRANGPLPPKDERKVDYVWGDAIDILASEQPDVKIINLETSVTTSATPWPYKGINYRMHPSNVGVITSANIDCCVLSNNHVIDWGYSGLDETLKVLRNSGLRTCGAGNDIDDARKPAIIDVPHKKGRILVFGIGDGSSGIPVAWKAKKSQSGVNYVDVGSEAELTKIREQVNGIKKPGDIAVMSVHWGGNWGYEIKKEHKQFAHNLIDTCNIDVIHGHSSHHPKAVEIYNGKLILYGAGDFINDYEGIGRSDYTMFRHDLSLMYFAKFDVNSGEVKELKMVPTQIKKLRVNRADEKDVQYLFEIMKKECGMFNLEVNREGDVLVLNVKSQ